MSKEAQGGAGNRLRLVLLVVGPTSLMCLALLSLLFLPLLRALLQRLTADANLLRLGGFGLRQRQMQDTMLEVRLRLVGVHRRGQGHTAVERPALALVR